MGTALGKEWLMASAYLEYDWRLEEAVLCKRRCISPSLLGIRHCLRVRPARLVQVDIANRSEDAAP